MKYTVVVGDDLEQFTKDVTAMLDIGWKAQGGVSTTRLLFPASETRDGYSCISTGYAQALVIRRD